MPGLLDPRFTHAYDTPEDAAAGAEMLLRHQPNYHQQEYSAIVTQGPDGKYYHSGFDRADSTADAEHSAPISQLLDQLPEGHKPYAVLHNHPDRKDKIPPEWLSQADLNIRQGYGSYDDKWQTLDKNKPVTTNGAPTGPLRMYLVSRDTNLGVDNGKARQLYDDGRNPAIHKYDAGMTDQVLANIPIEEWKLAMARQTMANTSMPGDMKVQILAHLIPGYGK